MAKNMVLIILLTIFIILFVIAGAGAGFFGYYAFQQKDYLRTCQSDLNEAKDGYTYFKAQYQTCSTSLKDCQSRSGSCTFQLNQLRSQYQQVVDECNKFAEDVERQQASQSGLTNLFKVLSLFI